MGRNASAQTPDLILLVAGFSYVGIAELTGGRTYANVNKHARDGNEVDDATADLDRV